MAGLPMVCPLRMSAVSDKGSNGVSNDAKSGVDLVLMSETKLVVFSPAGPCSQRVVPLQQSIVYLLLP